MNVRCAAIMAGGASSRMGQEKALLEIDGQPLIRRTTALLEALFPQLVVVTSNPQVAACAGIPAVEDRHPGKGPLAGIQTALTYYREPVFVVACDMPFLVPELIRYMADQYTNTPSLVPCGQYGPEPLHAIYHPQCLPDFNSFLEEDRVPSMRLILSSIGAEYVPADEVRRFSPNLQCFENWNTPVDIRDTSHS